MNSHDVVFYAGFFDPVTPRAIPPKPRRESIPNRLRFLVLERDHFTCGYCGRRPPEVQLVIDHIHPVALGGRSVEENLRSACQPCNAAKGANRLRARLFPPKIKRSPQFMDKLLRLAQRADDRHFMGQFETCMEACIDLDEDGQ